MINNTITITLDESGHVGLETIQNLVRVQLINIRQDAEGYPDQMDAAQAYGEIRRLCQDLDVKTE